MRNGLCMVSVCLSVLRRGKQIGSVVMVIVVDSDSVYHFIQISQSVLRSC